MWGIALDTDEDWDKQEAAQQQQHALFWAALKRLQRMMSDTTPHVDSISSVFRSFGQLGVDFDAVLPGVIGTAVQTGHKCCQWPVTCASAESMLAVAAGSSAGNLTAPGWHRGCAFQPSSSASCTACSSCQQLSRLQITCLCSCFLPNVELAGADDVADFVYGLQGLRHLPSGVIRHTMALAMMPRMLQLCSVEGQQPSSHDISTFLVGCAQLRLGVSEEDMNKLVAHQLCVKGQPRDALAVTAWSLAVMGHLQMHTLSALVKGIVAVSLFQDMSCPKELQLFMAMDYVPLRKRVKLTILLDHSKWMNASSWMSCGIHCSSSCTPLASSGSASAGAPYHLHMTSSLVPHCKSLASFLKPRMKLVGSGSALLYLTSTNKGRIFESLGKNH